MIRSIVGFCIASCFLFVCSGFAQLWEVQSHGPGMEWTRDMEFVNDSTIIAVGDDGLISRSTNLGVIWQDVNSPVTFRLRRVSFLNESQGWIVGEYGVILHTTDGGLSWTAQESGVTNTLRGIDFTDEMNGWIVGWHGTVLRTANGGNTWAEVDFNNITFDLLDVDFITPEIGWIVGGDYTSRAYRTTDGGTTWEDWVSSFPWLGTVQAINESTMVACGGGGIFVKWSGELHSEMNIGSNSLRDMQFVNDSVGFVAGDDSEIWRTLDGCSTWVRIYTGTGDSFAGITFRDSEIGFAGGSRRKLIATEDGGANWNDLVGSPYWSVDFADANQGMCLASNGDLLRTDDGGLHWNITQRLPLSELRCLRFASENEVWAIGAAGAALRSVNSGVDWQTITLPIANTLHDIAINGAHRWIASDAGVIQHSADGGETWEVQTQYIGNWLYGIDFIDDVNGIAVGGYGVIRRTDSGGVSWSYEWIDTSVDYYGIDVIDSEFAVVVGSGGHISRTFDGGETWDDWHYSNPATTFYVVRFLDRWSGWVMGTGGVVLHTVDGGETWIEQETSVSSTLRDFVLVPPYGWAVGDHRAILRYSFSESADDLNPPVVQTFSLSAYPNPFNPSTLLTYSLPQAGRAELQVFDIMGRLVETLEDRIMPAGTYTMPFDGSHCASGIYFARLSSNASVHTERIILLK